MVSYLLRGTEHFYSSNYWHVLSAPVCQVLNDIHLTVKDTKAREFSMQSASGRACLVPGLTHSKISYLTHNLVWHLKDEQLSALQSS